MKTKMILGIAAALMFSFTSMAQKGEKKKDWNPEKSLEMKVEKFSEEHDLTDAQSEALKKSLMEHYDETKALREAEQQRRKEMRETNHAKKQERVKSALQDEELSDAWIAFEKQQRQEMKEKRKNQSQDKKRGANHSKEQHSKE
jgi:hypothetical protein